MDTIGLRALFEFILHECREHMPSKISVRVFARLRAELNAKTESTQSVQK